MLLDCVLVCYVLLVCLCACVACCAWCACVACVLCVLVLLVCFVCLCAAKQFSIWGFEISEGKQKKSQNVKMDSSMIDKHIIITLYR